MNENMEYSVDFDSIVLKLASPENILSWSSGEVTKPETINYRSQRSERNGLFCERIFGPDKDWECYCGKYKKTRYKGVICEKCGVEVTRSIVRRERMGHIALATPVSHIWFLRGIPSRIGMMLGVPLVELEKVVYFSGYIVTRVNEQEKEDVLKEINLEYKTKTKAIDSKEEKDALKKSYTRAKAELDMLAMHSVLSEAEYYHLSKRYGEVFEVGTGAEAVHNIFKNLNLDELKKVLEEKVEKAVGKTSPEHIKVTKRLNLVKSMIASGIRPEWMFLTVIPIIPPALRPMVTLEGGRNATSDLNDLYRRVINRNNRLKRLVEIKAPDVICRNEKRILQEAVDALIDNTARRGQNIALHQGQRRPLKSLASMLKGKQGRFRQNLLGKRVDYSARSAIIVGPELKLHQCGLPKYIALELFRPFVISKLLKAELAYNIRRANHLIDDQTPEVWAILEDIIKDKYVLLNRAPTLHRLGIQAFQPVLVEGKAIRIHPLVCSAFNADFDGDQMAVHVPLGEEAQKEAKEIMSAAKNLLKPGNGSPTVNPTQGMVVGCFWLTTIKKGAKGEGKIFASPNEAILAYDFGIIDIRAEIKVLPSDKPKYAEFDGKIFETTVGRLLFNSVTPKDFLFINKKTGKKELEAIVHDLIEKYGVDATPPVLDKIKTFGFKYATMSGISWGIDDLQPPKEKGEIIGSAQKQEKEVKKQFDKHLITKHERYNKIVEIWTEAKDKVTEKVLPALDEMGSVRNMVDSSARGSLSQIAQMTGMRGLLVNPSGKIIEFPVIGNYKDGLNALEYFISTHGTRKGIVDTALKTAKAGYLTRRLADVGQNIVISKENCGDKEGIRVSRKEIEGYGKSFSARIFGRVLSKDAGKFKKGHLLSIMEAKELELNQKVEEIHIFSPITCASWRGVCQKCYGYDLATSKIIKLGEAIGIIAAQAIGEPGTQLTMRTFHTGGIASESDITMGLPRIEEIFELRIPKSPVVLCEEDGIVMEIKNAVPETLSVNQKTEKIIVVGKKEYRIPVGKIILVKEGDEVEKGDSMTSGTVNIKDLFKLGGEERAQNYIIREIAKVYTMQGALINEKHIEVIVRQMFARYTVDDPGDTRFNRSKVVERAELLEENDRIKKEGGVEATFTPTITRTTKVSTSTTSFLSAVSFQDTARILVERAVEGSEDKLYGLKENVIVGRLIPAGTGFRGDYIDKSKKNNASEEEGK